MAEPTVYLFDGYNLLHAGGAASRDELVDRLATFVALRGARGVAVFDGVGDDRDIGRLAVRFAEHADGLIERLAAELRSRERVAVVSSDAAVLGTAGQEVRHLSSRTFLRELDAAETSSPKPGPGRTRIEDALDAKTRARLEAWRRRR